MPLADAQPFIMAGMHRSGTSLAASVLQAAGIDMGERLLPAGVGNVKGHFEDMDFYEFHIALLEHHKLDPTGWTLEHPISVPDDFAARAGGLIEKKSHNGRAWGWKDPRTTLFLDFWRTLAPAARFIILYRPPWEVVDSLLRRGTDKELITDPLQAIRFATQYNRLAADFAARFPDRTLVVSNQAIAADPAAFLRAINTKFGLTLPPPASNPFDARVMKQDAQDSWHAAVLSQLAPDACAVYNQLNQLAALPAASIPTSSTLTRAAAEKLLKEWAAHCTTVNELAIATTHLKNQELRLAHLESEMAALRKHADGFNAHRAELTAAQSLIASLTNSRSWRLAAPLRKINEFIAPHRWTLKDLWKFPVTAEEEMVLEGARPRFILPGLFTSGRYELNARLAPPVAGATITCIFGSALVGPRTKSQCIADDQGRAQLIINLTQTASLCWIAVEPQTASFQEMSVRRMGSK